MTYMLDNTGVLPAATGRDSAASGKPGLLRRLLAAMIESRHRSAEREIRAHRMRIDEAGIVLGGIPFTNFSNDAALPFNR